MSSTAWLLTPTVALIAYPLYLLLVAAVLRICGVPRRDIAKWALKQADRQRLTELIRAARGLPPLAGGEPSARQLPEG